MKHPLNEHCVIRSGLEDTTEITAHSRLTFPPDLVGGHTHTHSSARACAHAHTHIDAGGDDHGVADGAQDC